MPRIHLSFDLDLVPHDADPDDDNVPTMSADELQRFLETADGRATLAEVFGGILPPGLIVGHAVKKPEELIAFLRHEPLTPEGSE